MTKFVYKSAALLLLGCLIGYLPSAAFGSAVAQSQLSSNHATHAEYAWVLTVDGKVFLGSEAQVSLAPKPGTQIQVQDSSVQSAQDNATKGKVSAKRRVRASLTRHKPMLTKANHRSGRKHRVDNRDDCSACHQFCLVASLACIAISIIDMCPLCGLVCIVAQEACDYVCTGTTPCRGLETKQNRKTTAPHGTAVQTAFK